MKRLNFDKWFVYDRSPKGNKECIVILYDKMHKEYYLLSEVQNNGPLLAYDSIWEIEQKLGFGLHKMKEYPDMYSYYYKEQAGNPKRSEHRLS